VAHLNRLGVPANSGTGGSPVESRYAAMFDRYSGRRRMSAAFFVCVKPSVAALEVVWSEYRPTPRRTAATGETPVPRKMAALSAL